MTEAYVYRTRSGPRRSAGRGAGAVPAGRPGRVRRTDPAGALARARPGGRGRGGARQRQRRRRGEPKRRSDGRAAGRAAGVGVGLDRESALRVEPDAAMGASRMIKAGDADVVATGGGRVDDQGAVGAAEAGQAVPDRQRHRGVDRARLAAGQPADESGVDGLARRGLRAARREARHLRGNGRMRSRCARTSWPTGPGPTGSTRTW